MKVQTIRKEKSIMAFCINCGHHMVDGAKFCNMCDEKAVEPQAENTQSYEQPQENNNGGAYNDSFARSAYAPNQNTYNQYNQYYNPQPRPVYNPYPQGNERSLAVRSMVFGILALALSELCFIPVLVFPMMALCITFLCVSFSMRRKYIRVAFIDNGFTRAGKICSIVAIPCTVLFSIYGIIFTSLL